MAVRANSDTRYGGPGTTLVAGEYRDDGDVEQQWCCSVCVYKAVQLSAERRLEVCEWWCYGERVYPRVSRGV